MHHAVGIFALGADVQAKDGVIRLDKFRFNMIIDGEGVLFIQRLRLIDNL